MKYYITCVQKRISPSGIYEDEERLRELVFCKDCKKFVKEDDQTYCLDMYGQCDENGFCAWAERREE